MKKNRNFNNEISWLFNPKIKSKIHKKINKKESINFLFEMIKIRLIEEKIAELVEKKIINTPTHLCIGQEAVPVGISKNLNKSDKIFGNHRSHGHLLAMGTNIESFFSELLGRSSGLCKGMGGSMHLIDKENGFHGSVPIVGGTIPIAAGAAFAEKYKRKKNISVAYFGDGASEEGVFHETLNLAKFYNLPILFVVENNLFSSHMDIELRQPSNKISRFAEPHKIKNILIDGNNVIEVYHQSKKIINYIKKKSQPALIEAITFRHLGHVGPKKDIDVGLKRNIYILNQWIKNRDPIANLEKLLIKKNFLNNSFLVKKKESIKRLINLELNKSMKSSYPKNKQLEQFVY